MQLPENPTLPLFAYGALQPGEVSFFRIRAFVEASRSRSVRGSTLVRDGLLIADEAGNSRVNGHLLSFHAEKCEAAYSAICDLEPSKQYRWGTVQIEGSMANILWGKSPRKGSVELDFDWSSWDDPLFTTALEVVQGQLDQFSSVLIEKFADKTARCSRGCRQRSWSRQRASGPCCSGRRTAEWISPATAWNDASLGGCIAL